MKLWNIDYIEATATIVSVKGYNSEDDANGAPQKDEAARLTLREKGELNNLPAPVLEALCEFKAKKGEKIESIDALWESFNPVPKSRAVKVPTAKEVAGKEDSSNIENSSDAALQSAPTDGTSSASGDTAVSENGVTAGKDESMSTPKGGKSKSAAKKKVVKKKVAKKKVAAKKKAAPKTPKAPRVKGERKAIPTGMPREGSKADKLLKLILRDGGATFAEMQKATGWKEMRGTASVLAERAGKKLTMIKDPEGKKATRWQAK